MKRSITTALLLFLTCCYNFCQGQTTVILQPDSTDGKDAEVWDLQLSTHYASNLLRGNAWTFNGIPGLQRAFLDFDLSVIPTNAIIQSAFLSLFAPDSPSTEFDSPRSGSNSAWLRRVTGQWNQNTITWNNQPSYTTKNQITLTVSTSAYQDYPNIDVTQLVRDMRNNTTSSFGFMIQLKTEKKYRRLSFCASNYPDSTKHPKLVITYLDCTSTAGTISALRDTICSGTPASLAVTGGSNTVQWQSSSSSVNYTNIAGATGTALTDLPAQTTYYRVVAGSGSCKDTSAAYKIIVKPSPQTDFTCNSSGLKAAFALTGNLGDITSYHWNFGDSSSASKPSPNHTYDSPGSYHVCITVFNGSNCSFTICRDIPVYPVGVKQIIPQCSRIVYPNPFSNHLFINMENANEHIEDIEVFDLTGRRVYSESFPKEEYLKSIRKIELTALLQGIYYLKIKTTAAGYLQLIIKQ